jgi:porphobilinogen synthase
MTPTAAPFPAARFRRARRTPALRALTQENALTPGDLIWPIFVRDGKGIEEPVGSMPGVIRRSVDKIAQAAKHAQSLGIPAICLFPYTDDSLKTEDCAEAWNQRHGT